MALVLNFEEVLEDLNAYDEKAYLTIWGTGYAKNPHAEILSLYAFSEDRGYDKKDIEKIKGLDVGEVANLSQMETHLVFRVK